MVEKSEPKHLGTRHWLRYHARPISKNAKYYTYCKNCKATLIRVPDSTAGYAGSRLAHPIIAIDDKGADIIGWRDHCVFGPDNFEDYRTKKGPVKKRAST